MSAHGRDDEVIVAIRCSYFAWLPPVVIQLDKYELANRNGLDMNCLGLWPAFFRAALEFDLDVPYDFDPGSSTICSPHIEAIYSDGSELWGFQDQCLRQHYIHLERIYAGDHDDPVAAVAADQGASA